MSAEEGRKREASTRHERTNVLKGCEGLDYGTGGGEGEKRRKREDESERPGAEAVEEADGAHEASSVFG